MASLCGGDEFGEGNMDLVLVVPFMRMMEWFCGFSLVFPIRMPFAINKALLFLNIACVNVFFQQHLI